MIAGAEAAKARIDEALPARLARLSAGAPPRLAEAMAYAALGGGKRLRPVLALLAHEASGGGAETAELALDFAAALELVHTYSLVHDDLPAMDDDDLRRGRPTCHKVYGEATAILVGDALLTGAFELVAAGTQPARVRLAALLARAAGAAGMVGGQELDLALEGRLGAPPALGEVEDVHRRKTGALLACSVEGGGLCAGAPEERLAELRAYGDAIGLAFQIADDLLDIEGDPGEMGKAGRGDAAKGKPTVPALIGAPAARQLAARAGERAREALRGWDERAEPLRALASWAASRRR